ncbi:MAG: sigma-70 family RNA polymerase sigma factor [Verrucomicrobiota bacterium]
MKRAEHIYEEHAPAMLLYARQITGNHADAEDALQNGFVRAFSGKSEPPENPVPWIYRAIKWAALDILRSRKRRNQLDDQLRDDAGAEAWFKPGEPESGDAELLEKLSRLRPEHREIISLKIWSRMTFKEIAGVLDIPANTAASRYRYALDALRKTIKPVEETLS